ncbi:prepilin peptidase [Herbiconiux solani]|uniref:prepilin peptidase n=1 Tax=Herbiconiux solani TaxID=661329 RepID=UPI000825E876|nr:prepilin peptidase [Herbiconiux solani]
MSIVTEPWVLLLLAYLAAVSVPLALTDARRLRLPNAYVVPGLGLLACSVLAVTLRAPPGSAAGAAALAASAGAAAVAGGAWAAGMLGMGDVKLAVLLAGASSLTDARAPILWCGTTGVLAAAGVAAVLSGAGRSTEERATAAVRIPLGPPMLAAFWFAILTCLPP